MMAPNVLILHTCLLIAVHCMAQEGTVEDIDEHDCLQNAVRRFNLTTFTNLEPKCVTIFMDKYMEMKNSLNFTDEQMNYIFSLERAMSIKDERENNRHKRQVITRLRQECRTLSEGARSALFSAIAALKPSAMGMSRYDTIAGLHDMLVFQTAHNGPNFLGWHRVYINLFEMALQEIRPDVVLCYWDSTLDFLMPGDAQRRSVTFSTEFFGNGRGNVINGPFANWQLPGGGTLQRRIGESRTSLTRPGIVDLITTDPRITNHTQIVVGGIGFTDPDVGQPGYSLEREHDNTQAWVGGVMQSVLSSPQDPIFWFHHTYIDYVWELFRQKINPNGGFDLRGDYPDVNGRLQNTELKPMVVFPGIRNVDGYSNKYNRMYALHPQCGNNCGGSTRYLYCPNDAHTTNPSQRCVSNEIDSDLVPEAAVSPAAVPVVAASGSAERNGNAASVSTARVPLQIVDSLALRAAMSEPPLQLSGPFFQSSFADPRL